MMLTVRVLVPMEEKLSSMLAVMPLPRPTMTITAMMPMMMPRHGQQGAEFVAPDVFRAAEGLIDHGVASCSGV